MPPSKKQEKTTDPVKSVGLTPSQTEHLVMAYLCMEKTKVDWKKLGELCNVTSASARTVFGRAKRCLEKWEEQRAAAAAIKEAEEAEDDEENEDDDKDSDGAVEAASAQGGEN